jgi:hypothetical protein
MPDHSQPGETRSTADIEFDAEALAIAHEQAIDSMAEDQLLAMSRELLALVIRAKARAKNEHVARPDALRAVFLAEAQARARGAKARLDIFTPIERELPGEDLG